MAVTRIDILTKMRDYYGSYVNINQLRNDLKVPNSSNDENYISFRQTVRNLVKDGLLEYDDITKKTHEDYRPEYREDVINNQFGSWKIRITSNGIREVREENSTKNINKNENSSTIKIGRARDVHIDQSQKISNDKNVVIYKGEKQDNSLFDFLSKEVLDRFGIKKTIISGLIMTLGGLGGLSVSINSLFTGAKVLKDFPQLSSTIGQPVFAISFVLLVTGAIFLGLYEYKLSTRCPKCKEYYTLTEYKNPTIKEIKVKGGTKINGTRYIECTNCGNKTTREFTDFEEDESS